MQVIKIDDTRQIVVRHKLLNGRAILDIRRFYRTKEERGFMPTNKGIGFDVIRARAVIDAMVIALASEPEPDNLNAPPETASAESASAATGAESLSRQAVAAPGREHVPQRVPRPASRDD